MSELFPQSDIDEMVAKLTNGDIVGALMQALSNEKINRLTELQKQKKTLTNQILIINDRIALIDSEYAQIINPESE